MKTLKKILFKIYEMLQKNDGSGKLDISKFVMFATFVISSISLWGPIFIIALVKFNFPILSIELVGLYLAANGVGAGTKILKDKFKDKNVTDVTDCSEEEKKE